MSDIRKCKVCEKDYAADQFLPEPPAVHAHKCLNCLPTNARGFTRCERCHVRKLHAEYDKRRGGRLARICKECFPRKRRFKTCRKCGEEKPMAAFGAIVKPSGSIRRREDCSSCYKPTVLSKICVKCGEQLARDAFATQAYRRSDGSAGFRRSSACNSCAESKSAPSRRRCRGCGEEKELTDFRRLVGGSRTQRCKACPPHGPGNRRGHLMRRLEQPCLQCGEEMWTTKPRSRTDGVKYCSVHCFRLGRAEESRYCDQCQELLPGTDFDPQPPTKSRVVWRCRQCMQDIREGRTLAKPGCSTPANVLRNLRYRAAKEDVPLKASYRQIRELLAGDCCFCGGPSETVAPFEPKEPLDAANLRSICAACRHFVTPRTVAEVAAFVSRAAALQQPAETPTILRPKRRKERLEPPPPTGLRKSDMVPLEVHGAPIAGETWEEKVARYAKPKGPWSSKKKTADEEI